MYMFSVSNSSDVAGNMIMKDEEAYKEKLRIQDEEYEKVQTKIKWSYGGGPKSWYRQAFEKPGQARAQAQAQALPRPRGLYNPLAEHKRPFSFHFISFHFISFHFIY